jgi:uncharacterized membrane protein YidH (DUF202 family)
MLDVFIDLLPLILGAILAPIYPIIVLLLLQSERGLRKSIAFVAGAVAVRLVQGLIFGLAFAPAVDAESAAGIQLIGPTLLTIVGILLLTMGVKKWRKGNDDEDGDEPPAWMSRLTDISAFKAAGSGALLILLAVKQWVFTLSAISIIEEAQPGTMAGIGLYLLFTLATQILVLPPIIAFAIAPQQSAAPLHAARNWLQRHNRVIVIVVSLVFGAFFLYNGLTGLLAFRVL